MKQDLTAGAAVFLSGTLFAGYALYSLPIGTVRQMGPGMFPMGLGVLLAVFGICIAVPAWFRDQARPKLPLRSMIGVLGAVAAFSLLIRPFGLMPAVAVTAAIGALAIPGGKPLAIALLCLCLCVLTWLLFVVLLQIQMPLLRWGL